MYKTYNNTFKLKSLDISTSKSMYITDRSVFVFYLPLQVHSSRPGGLPICEMAYFCKIAKGKHKLGRPPGPLIGGGGGAPQELS